jgi:hypothetical protein
MTPEICPTCGADVPRRARSCPGCGADEQTGWSDEGRLSSLDLPDDSFDYDEYVRREFEPEKKRELKPRGIPTVWWVVAIILLTLGLLTFLGPLFRKGLAP